MPQFYRLRDVPKSNDAKIVFREDLVFIEGTEFYVIHENYTANPPRTKIPVVPCTEAFVKYLQKRDELLAARQIGGGYYSEAEDPILEDMDDLWSNLNAEELLFIRCQRSWKFGPEPQVAERSALAAYLEEARLLGGAVELRWNCPHLMVKHLMTAQEFHEMLRDFDTMLATVEQEYCPEDNRHKLATAMRKRWLP